MLISHKKKFIFIHIHKNAGTSITTALLPFAANSRWQYYVDRIMKRINISLFDTGTQPFQPHIKASELISKIGKETFQSFFSFAIVRNPWDWQVSLYKYILKDKNHFLHQLINTFDDFEEFIEWRVVKGLEFQKDYAFSKEGEQIVDFIGKYENIESDFQIICSRIGIKTSLPKLNVSNTIPYQNYYNQKTRDLVERAFEPDISLFNYQF